MAATTVKQKSTIQSTSRKVIAIGMMLLFYFQMWGFSTDQYFPEGAELYVVAHSGLTLREEPSTHAEVLAIADYGSMVEVLPAEGRPLENIRFNWVSGSWIYVSYDGINGYMFDGYLSDLPMPVYEFEKCYLDLNLIYPLESWVDVNLETIQTKYTEAGLLTRVTTEFNGDHKLVQSQKGEEYKMELYLSDIRLMDAYHLLQSMIENKDRLEVFKNNSTFFKNEEGELSKVKVNIDHPVEFRKLQNGRVKIIIRSTEYPCSL